MPTYGYRCTNAECNELREDVASIKSYEEHHPPCLVCATPCNYEYIPTVPQAILKDGPSGSWPSKGERIKKQMQKRSEDAGRRQKERFGENVGKLVPNFDGKETGTWQEAQFQAQKERGEQSAATFEKRVTEEKSKDTKIVVGPK